MNSSSPPDSASINSFLRAGRNFRVSGWRFSHGLRDQVLQLHALQAGAELRERLGRDVGSGGSGCRERARRTRAGRPRPARGSRSAATPGFCTRPGFSSVRFSAIRQMVTSACRKRGILRPALQDDQRSCGPPGMRERRPRARWFGEVDDEGDLLPSSDAQPQVVVEQIQHAVGIARQALRVVGAVKLS